MRKWHLSAINGQAVASVTLDEDTRTITIDPQPGYVVKEKEKVDD